MKQLFMTIHKALHDPSVKTVNVNGEEKVIETKGDNNLRYVTIWDEGKQWEVVQQNPKTASVYAARARKGEKITWIIPLEHGFRITYKPWHSITDETLPDV